MKCQIKEKKNGDTRRAVVYILKKYLNFPQKTDREAKHDPKDVKADCNTSRMHKLCFHSFPNGQGNHRIKEKNVEKKPQ